MNNQTTILITIIALLVGGISGYAIAHKISGYGPGGCIVEAMKDIPVGMHRMPDGTLMGDAGTGMMGDADAPMGHMMDMMVSSEREFIEGMIPHHQEAVDTAKEVIERGGTTSEIKELVENIVFAQEQEIAEMKQWYEDWYGETYADTGEYEPMMRELEGLSGEEIDRRFLEDMIGHHMGAIMMARSVTPHIEHQEIQTLTEAIITSQSAEIRQMQQMLQGL